MRQILGEMEVLLMARKQCIAKCIVIVLLLALCAPMITFANPTVIEDDSNPPRNTIQIEEPAPRVWQPNMITERTLTRRREGLELRAPIPVVTSAFGSEYVALNSRINEVIESLISEARRISGARTLTFSYEVYHTAEVVSIVIEARVQSTLPRTLVRSVNFSLYDGRLLTINQAMGANILPLAERVLADRIRNNPEHYYAALNAPVMDQAFYVTNEGLVILFDGFSLSSSSGDISTIQFTHADIRTHRLPRTDYYIQAGYLLKMIPLRLVAETGLGWEVDWHTHRGNPILLVNRDTVIELVIADVQYIVSGVTHTLENAPMMRNTSTYVPITFFDQIMPLTSYSIDAGGTITFIAYLGNP